VYLKTVIPAPGSTGEYRGFLIYQGSTTAIDGNVWMANIQDSKVYVYRAADLEGAQPRPVKVFDATTDGISFPHLMIRRPGTQEVWLTNRPVDAPGYLLRFNGETHTVITTPTATLETTSTTGDEPNEFSFSKDGLLAYVGHHGAVPTGSPTNQMHVAIVDAAAFTVKTLVPMIASATAPGYIVLYCHAPFCGESKRLSADLVEAGYTHVRRYQLGISVWRALGGLAEIEPEGLRCVLAGDRTAVFIDARDPEEFAAQSLTGSRNSPWSGLKKDVGEVKAAKDDGRLPMEDHNTRIIVFGRDGAQAKVVAEAIAQEAFHNVAYFGDTFETLMQQVAGKLDGPRRARRL
jgi:rhodanese-related sulfurtransferase